MKEILGHKSWNEQEIIIMLRDKRNYTMPTLPHYRYNRVQSTCARLKQFKLIEKTGRTDVSINYVPTPLFDEWIKELKLDTLSKIEKHWKLLNPRKPRIKTCQGCGDKFETLNYPQKFCKPICKPIKNYKKDKTNADKE